ncbi:hypothetical protein W97_03668 [Coniosporium apollinis CBS 100218]|uniref:DNA-directed RNA polymerase II subunit RPB9-like zinc ribbon domain-containing protein n=1 Tax=Coniosporium apollinis (strain CBS 100218) TaxID=1168221 RepID=R7YR94_CONA1|nr:uncharacterized protein W97_03668 [Coniosporium apollinis CBS 100218]EON64437.1 hypothetical protein W97_03668 [Coniosporium apollinis CBS 100218]
MAASPSASDGAAAAQSRKVAFRFCGECSNLLYPQEDTENNKLMFACRSCRYSEPAHSNCVYRNELSSTVGETAGVTIDVASDPTVGEPIPGFCTMCGSEIFCVKCGQETENGFYLEVEDFDVHMVSCETSPIAESAPHPFGRKDSADPNTSKT